MKTTWGGWPGRGRRTRQTDLSDLLEPLPGPDDAAALHDDSTGGECGCDECGCERVQGRLLELYALGDLGDRQIALPDDRETLFGVLPAETTRERELVELALERHWRLTDSGYVPGTMRDYELAKRERARV